MYSLTTDIADIFNDQGILAQSLPDYELRPGQIKMAQAVSQALDSNQLAWQSEDNLSELKAQMLAVEAGTGIGKTLAYLVPACLSGQKVVVSTGTLNLQEQILNKEIPFIKEHINPEIKAICVKGRQNYACLYRCNQFLSAPQMHLFSDNTEIDQLNDWLANTETGDRAELEWLPDKSSLWELIESSTNKCLGAKCPDFSSCFITRLRKKAAASQILIVNHHLFFSDLAIRRFGHAEVLPRYQTVIFDEAHHIENIATRYFGITFSHYQLLDLVKDLETLAQNNLDAKSKKKTVQIARNLATQATIFAQIFPSQKGRYPLSEIIENTPEWSQELSDLTTALEILNSHLNSTILHQDHWDSPRRRCLELLENLQAITIDQDSSTVYWCERRQKTITLSASPIEVASDLRQYLYTQVESIIFTSATLTASGKFTYMYNRLGLDQDTETLSLASPFDYKNRTRLFIPSTPFPEPNNPACARQVQEQCLQIIKASRGRAMLLFTSNFAMREMHKFLCETDLSFPILMQGDAPKNVLLDIFQKQTNSVLLAVASFWEGINVPGESLSCVIIDKLPFEVPSDPVIMARINRIKAEAGKPFFDFQVPRAILSLRQGLGRLMRANSDQGLLAVMDIRLYSKGYGRLFLKSLPQSPIIRSIDQVNNFFEEIE